MKHVIFLTIRLFLVLMYLTEVVRKLSVWFMELIMQCMVKYMVF